MFWTTKFYRRKQSTVIVDSANLVGWTSTENYISITLSQFIFFELIFKNDFLECDRYAIWSWQNIKIYYAVSTTVTSTCSVVPLTNQTQMFPNYPNCLIKNFSILIRGAMFYFWTIFKWLTILKPLLNI